MLGFGTTVACYVMSRNMGHEGVLTSSVVMLTTLFSSFTVTGWLYILRTLGLIWKTTGRIIRTDSAGGF